MCAGATCARVNTAILRTDVVLPEVAEPAAAHAAVDEEARVLALLVRERRARVRLARRRRRAVRDRNVPGKRVRVRLQLQRVQIVQVPASEGGTQTQTAAAGCRSRWDICWKRCQQRWKRGRGCTFVKCGLIPTRVFKTGFILTGFQIYPRAQRTAQLYLRSQDLTAMGDQAVEIQTFGQSKTRWSFGCSNHPRARYTDAPILCPYFYTADIYTLDLSVLLQQTGPCRCYLGMLFLGSSLSFAKPPNRYTRFPRIVKL